MAAWEPQILESHATKLEGESVVGYGLWAFATDVATSGSCKALLEAT